MQERSKEIRVSCKCRRRGQEVERREERLEGRFVRGKEARAKNIREKWRIN